MVGIKLLVSLGRYFNNFSTFAITTTAVNWVHGFEVMKQRERPPGHTSQAFIGIQAICGRPSHGCVELPQRTCFPTISLCVYLHGSESCYDCNNIQTYPLLIKEAMISFAGTNVIEMQFGLDF